MEPVGLRWHDLEEEMVKKSIVIIFTIINYVKKEYNID